MSCQFVQESISSYLDSRLTEPERRNVALHLADCRECAALHGQMSELRNSLRSLPTPLAPASLRTELQVLASREMLRRRHTGSIPALIEFWKDRARLVIDNLMRPLALPFAGGLASALFSFAMLMPNLGFLHNAANDRPSAFYTEASVDSMDSMADIGSRSKTSDDTLIEVQIDGQGRMVDYSVLQGQMTSEIGNLLLFTTFNPATFFMQPTSGKIVIRRSRIVVQG